MALTRWGKTHLLYLLNHISRPNQLIPSHLETLNTHFISLHLVWISGSLFFILLQLEKEQSTSSRRPSEHIFERSASTEVTPTTIAFTGGLRHLQSNFRRVFSPRSVIFLTTDAFLPPRHRTLVGECFLLPHRSSF